MRSSVHTVSSAVLLSEKTIKRDDTFRSLSTKQLRVESKVSSCGLTSGPKFWIFNTIKSMDFNSNFVKFVKVFNSEWLTQEEPILKSNNSPLRWSVPLFSSELVNIYSYKASFMKALHTRIFYKARSAYNLHVYVYYRSYSVIRVTYVYCIIRIVDVHNRKSASVILKILVNEIDSFSPSPFIPKS